MTTETSSAAAPSFELRGSLFTLTVMRLRTAELAAIDRQLEQKLQQAPGFFQNAPVIIDLENIAAADTGVDFVGLYDLLRNRGMIPVAIRNGSEAQQQAAAIARLPALPQRSVATPEAAPATETPEASPEASPEAPPEPKASPKAAANDAGLTAAAPDGEAPPRPHYRLYDQPVRSGQKVYARGDLILLGPVSAGAEVVADGNIHAYGPFRGRALVGASGDKKARFFCHQLEAELVAVAGHYRVIEPNDGAIWQQHVQAYLDQDERLLIVKMSR